MLLSEINEDIRDKIVKENKKFWKSRYILDPAYFKFMKDLLLNFNPREARDSELPSVDDIRALIESGSRLYYTTPSNDTGGFI